MKKVGAAVGNRSTHNMPKLLPSVAEAPELQAIRDSMPEGSREIQLSPHEGTLLRLLLQLMAAEKVLEVGTGIGYSTAWLAGGLPSYGYMLTIEKSEVYYQQA